MKSEQKKTILYNALLIEEHERHKSNGKKRNILNKWFIDNTKAFLMRCVAGTLLVDSLEMKDNKEVQQYVNMNRNPNLPMYLSCILKYFELIIQYDLSDKLNQNLLKYIDSKDKRIEMKDLENYSVLKRIRTRFISALLYCYFNLYEHNPLRAQSFENFFDIWNETFPDHPIEQKRRNKYQVRKEEMLEKEENDSRTQQQQQESIESQFSQFTKNPESVKIMKEQLPTEKNYCQKKNQNRKMRTWNKEGSPIKKQLGYENASENSDIIPRKSRNDPNYSFTKDVSPCSNNNNNNKESNSKQSEDTNSLYDTFVKQNQIQEEKPFLISDLEQQDQRVIIDFEQNNQFQMGCDLIQVEWNSNNSNVTIMLDNKYEFIVEDPFSNNHEQEQEQQQFELENYSYSQQSYSMLDISVLKQSIDQSDEERIYSIINKNTF